MALPLIVRVLVAGMLVSTALPLPADDAWISLRVPGFWEKRSGGALENHDGFGWYRAFVEVPGSWKGRELALELGPIDDCDETFFNGEKIGATGSIEPYRSASNVSRKYPIDPKLARFGGPNMIAVRVFDGGGAGGFGNGRPVLSAGGESLRLSGVWKFHAGDDLRWARWPIDPGSSVAAQLAAAFYKEAGGKFGKPDVPAALPGTELLTVEEDMASLLVAGVDRFLLRKLEESIAGRERHWKRDLSSYENYQRSIEPNRKRLAQILGVRENRTPFSGIELVATTARPSLVGRGEGYEIHAARWPVLGDMQGEGLLILPVGSRPAADIIAIPDADQTPEQVAGLAPGIPPESQFARKLAEAGCRVIIPALVSRAIDQHGIEPSWPHTRLTHREFIYRSAFEMGRHIIGYEVQKVLALVDWLSRENQASSPGASARIGVFGYGEGGGIALYAAALDPRIQGSCISGYFNSRQAVWQEPIDRNVFGLLEQFGDAELAAMAAPRPVIIEAAKGPELVLPGQGGAPASLTTPALPAVQQEADRARALVAGLRPETWLTLISDGAEGNGPFGGAPAVGALVRAVSGGFTQRPAAPPEPAGPLPDAAARLVRQIRGMDRHNQWLLRESPFVRTQFFKDLDASSPEKYRQTVEVYRQYFRDEVIGRFDDRPLPPRPRSRESYDEPLWTGYEVALDLFPDVFAYGILLLPKDLREGEKRPVVVCQHGLEGRPQDIVSGDNPAYHDFAARLAERGFITFAPQNLYIFTDRFRTLQRKANPLKKTLFSIIVPQHQQIVDWLKTLPWVDPDRIGFYGLSYGGKTAMRVPPLVADYKLSICSADFNEWVWKNASTRSNHSYVWTGEYEIFEFDLGSTFNYAEMAALIAPRPFMVERGHFDGVAPDETVGYEFAKVRNLYEARLKLAGGCEIEWFVGPHTINGKGTYEFLHRWLNWPAPRKN